VERKGERERESARAYPKSFCASSSAPAYAIVLRCGLGSCAWGKRVADEVGDGGFIYPSYSPKVSVFISTTRAFEELHKFSQISGLICTLFDESVSGRIASMFLFRYLFFLFLSASLAASQIVALVLRGYCFGCVGQSTLKWRNFCHLLCNTGMTELSSCVIESLVLLASRICRTKYRFCRHVTHDVFRV
jgi:hypothetical protein